MDGGDFILVTRVSRFVVCGKHLYLVVSHTLVANKRNPRGLSPRKIFVIL